jgi:hypothetical protein
MKSKAYLTLAPCLLFATALHAVDPAPGTYASIFGGVSYEPDIRFNATNPLLGVINPITGQPFNVSRNTIPVDLGFDVMIDAGAEIGYRFCDNIRLGFELLYNNNPYNYLHVGDVTFHSPDVTSGFRMHGSTTAGYGLVNGYYDFLSDDPSSSIVPYVGIGGGVAYVYNVVQFYYNNVYIENTRQTHSSARPAGQIILGVNKFMDDFASIGLDIRGLATTNMSVTTRATKQSFDANLAIITVNVIFSGAFDLG